MTQALQNEESAPRVEESVRARSAKSWGGRGRPGIRWRDAVGSWFGDDIFVSYAREDATSYAANLASQLAKRDFACYIDMWTTSPGRQLPPELTRAIRRAGVFVLVASAAAMRSQAVKHEILEFSVTRRAFVLVSLESSLQDAVWFDHVRGAAETRDDAWRRSGAPSSAVVDRIVSSFTLRTRNQRLLRIFLGLLALALISAGAVGSFWTSAGIAKQEARDAETERKQTEARLEAEGAIIRSNFEVVSKAAESLQMLDSAPRRGLELATQAAGHETPQTRAALFGALAKWGPVAALIPVNEDIRDRGLAISYLGMLSFAASPTPELLSVENRHVHVWRLDKVREVERYENPDTIFAAAANEHWIALASWDNRAHGNGDYVRLFSRQGGVDRKICSPLGYVKSLTLVDDHTLFGFASFEGIAVWNLDTGEYLKSPLARGAFAVSPSGKWVAIAQGTRTLVMDRTLTVRGAPVFVGLKISSLAFADDDRLLGVEAGVTRQVALDTRRENELPKRILPGEVEVRELAANGRFVYRHQHEFAVSMEGYPYDVPLAFARAYDSGQVTFDRSGRFVAALSEPGTVGVWDLESRPFGVQSGPGSGTTVLDLSEEHRVRLDNERLTVDAQGEHRSFALEHALGEHPSIAIPDSAPLFPRNDAPWKLAGVDFHGVLRIVTLGDGASSELVLNRPVQHDAYVALSTNGSTVAYCDQGLHRIDVSHVESLRELSPLSLSCMSNQPLALSHDGQLAAVISSDSLSTQAEVWDTVKGQQLISFRGQELLHIKSMAFARDGRTFAVKQDSGLELWDITATPHATLLSVIGEFPFNAAPDGDQVRFSRDSCRLISWDWNRQAITPLCLMSWRRTAEQVLAWSSH